MPTRRPQRVTNEERRSWLSRGIAAWREIEHDASWFILANFLDAAVTWILLTRGQRTGLGHTFIIESNRFARYFLDHWGLKGLFGFKLSMVALVCLIALIVATRRAETSRWLFRVGTLVVIVVVFYSVWLYVQ
jgi:hypothetical protein